MAIEKITTWEKSVDSEAPGKGALITKKITRTDATGDGILYILPFVEIYAIAMNLTGDGSILISNSSPKDIEAGTGVFEAWDEVSEINLGITAIQIVWVSATVVAEIAIKTVGS